MGIKINLGAWNGVFAVPTEVVDKYIMLAGGQQLKVLLWLLRHNDREYTSEEIGNELRINSEDIEDCVGFWQAVGLLTQNNNDFVPPPVSAEPELPIPNVTISVPEKPVKEKKETAHKKASTRPAIPDPAFVSERIREDESISILFSEAERIFGRPISSGESGKLLLLHDHEGLPVDVLIMLLQFAKDMNKGMRYIETMAISWAADEIDTIEKAENKIERINEAKKAWGTVCTVFGLEHHSPTKKEKSLAECWVLEWLFPVPMLREAYEVCVNATGKCSMSYINKILENWHANGIKTLEQARNSGEEWKKKNTKSKPAETSKKKSDSGINGKPSYDIELFENTSIFD